LKYVSFLLTPFSIILRRDENFRRLLKRTRKTAWLAGYYFCRLDAWWTIPPFLLAYFLAGWYNPVLWRRM